MENIYYIGKTTIEKIANNNLETEILTYENGRLVKFGLIDENQNLLIDYEIYTITGFFGNNKFLVFNYPKNENYLYDAST